MDKFMGLPQQGRKERSQGLIHRGILSGCAFVHILLAILTSNVCQRRNVQTPVCVLSIAAAK